MIACEIYTLIDNQQVNESSMRRATRESARTPFVRSPTVTRGPRGQQGRRGLVGGAFGWRGSSLLGRWDPSAGASILAPFSSWTCGDSRSGPRTLAHRLPPLEPQASKRHDVPDLRRRATREQRGRPEHPRVEPPGASFAARHVTRARLLEKTRRLLLSFISTTIPHVSFFFVEKPQRQVAPSPTTDASRPRPTPSSAPTSPDRTSTTPFDRLTAGQVPQARLRPGRRRFGERKPPQEAERRGGFPRAARADDQRGARREVRPATRTLTARAPRVAVTPSRKARSRRE